MEIDSGFIFNKSEIQNLNTQPRHSLNYENDKTTLPYLPQRLYNSNGNNNRKTHFRMALFVAIKKVIVYRKNCHWAHRFICTSNFGVPFRRADKLFIRYARWSKNQRKTYVHNACVSNLLVFLMPINAFIQLQFTGAKKRSASSVWITAMSAAWHFKSSHRQQNDPKKCSMNRWEAIVWCLWFHATEFPFSLTAIESIWIHSYVVVCVCVILARFRCPIKCKFDSIINHTLTAHTLNLHWATVYRHGLGLGALSYFLFYYLIEITIHWILFSIYFIKRLNNIKSKIKVT